ncbi:hypothetical protein LIER_01779 [Lithospermum erythrorhizon]|uniref:E2F-associated phosphoprotein n=1 Tax=Lithospermum erythrorhizon TaxID=34254 RepID=A0AAV3NNE4_LITER
MENHEADQDIEQETPQSPTTVSDDDEIDYSIKPEFYDPNLDDKDELWAQKKRSSYYSDAVLSCPACFTTLCLESQRHETIVTQYRAIFVLNCKINETGLVQEPGSKRKRGGRKTGANADAPPVASESFKRVCCAVCSTRVGVIDEEEVYHFLNVFPSEP